MTEEQEDAMRQALSVLKNSQDYKMGRASTIEAAEDLQEALEQQPAVEAPFQPDWMNYQEGFSAGVLEGREQMKQQPADDPVAFEQWLEILRKNPTATDDVIGAYLRGHAEHLTGEKFILETRPQPAAWVGLTESDRRLINYKWRDGNGTATEIMDLTEAKLREKNTLKDTP